MWIDMNMKMTSCGHKDNTLTVAARKYAIKQTIDWMRKQTYQEYPGGPMERIITDDMIKEYLKEVEPSLLSEFK
jgi:hypothetical protein